jgi:two-component system, sensor histidine kinase and response regulator
MTPPINKEPDSAKILIIDDEPVICQTLEALLTGESYLFASANNGSEGLEKVASFEPDVILLDVMMPGMDGIEVCRRLKGSPRWRNIPIILVTALDDKEDLAYGLNTGADEFLSKPVNSLELQARVHSMLRIKRQYDDLEKLIHLRDDLANMIVHDMRSPLSIILGSSEGLLNNSSFTPLDHRRAERIFNQAQRLNTLMGDLLLQAKMEKGVLSVNCSQIDMVQLVSEVEQNQNTVAEARSIQFHLELPGQPCVVFGDAHLLTRVLDNLVSNALKFSPAGGIVILRLSCFANPEKSPVMRFEVIDTGPGVPAESREKIFDKFKIVELKQNGLSQIGLGLAFCKMVVDAHQGQISVAPNVPRGSIFTMELPMENLGRVSGLDRPLVANRI